MRDRLRSSQSTSKPRTGAAHRFAPIALCHDRSTRVANSEAAAAVLLPLLAAAEVEEFHVLCLDANLAVKHAEMIARGSVGQVDVHPREVFVPAVRVRVSYVLVCHNHPADDPTPSEADQELTERLVEAGGILGIPVLDHIIIGKAGDFVSFADRGFLECPVRDYPTPF